MKMKTFLMSALTASVLAACGNIPTFNTTAQHSAPVVIAGRYQLAHSHWSDVAKIRAEANRLAAQVRSEKMTKVQAAQYLNRFRVNLVGHNSVDDSVYEVYQQAAVDSQRGNIDASQSRAYVENALRGWQQRWPNMQNKPTNPAFTNFLLELMNMQPLQ